MCAAVRRRTRLFLGGGRAAHDRARRGRACAAGCGGGAAAVRRGAAKWRAAQVACAYSLKAACSTAGGLRLACRNFMPALFRLHELYKLAEKNFYVRSSLTERTCNLTINLVPSSLGTTTSRSPSTRTVKPVDGGGGWDAAAFGAGRATGGRSAASRTPGKNCPPQATPLHSTHSTCALGLERRWPFGARHRRTDGRHVTMRPFQSTC